MSNRKARLPTFFLFKEIRYFQTPHMLLIKSSLNLTRNPKASELTGFHL